MSVDNKKQTYDAGPSISVILTTYNHPIWLEKVLWGYEAQTTHDFEIVIADDGSRDDTRDTIARMQSLVSYPIQHIWHKDDGFQKCVIMNKSILASKADYLLFSDGDCIPREDYIAMHLSQREPGRFLSCGYYKLDLELSKAITKENILNGDCFDLSWLKAHGLPSTFKNNKFTRQSWKVKLLNAITTTKPTWNGHGASTWKKHVLETNGFDERMQYGGQDREFGERLENMGIHGKQVRYSSTVLHLDHGRGYATPESIAKNKAIRKQTRTQGVQRTPYGIIKDNQE
ncbi:MAG TPA: glycosyltransferase family 2 protein [Bacteroidaceae bacterium]|nr:glycosyltransferase family 2 protein [Bacteroidaceae bacterium]